VLAAACTSPDRQQATATSQVSAAPTQRDYWPTAGWRTATPNQQGMDPAVLDDLDTIVPASYPQVRSVLVVRHGNLVVERYWQGVTASDGHNSLSVTKSFVSALVGIALGDGSCGAWTRPSRSCWPTICPPTRIPACGGSL
jgi:CubicO group peptidase (beta-lactamase class C family)